VTTPSPPGASRHVAPVVALLAVVALGGWLRLGRIEQASPFLWDDAIHHLESVWLRDTLHFARTSFALKLAEARGGGDLWTWQAERARFAREVGGIPPRFGRPGHMALLALAMAFVGPVVWAGPLVSALAGTLAILALAGLVRSAARDSPHRAWMAIVAALWLAVDPLSVRLSREGLADADGALFAVLAFWAYVRARRHGSRLSWCALAGAVAGIAFTVQTRDFLVLGFLLGWELAPGSLAAGRGLAERTKRAVTIAASAIVPPALCELPYYLALLVGRSHGIAPDLRSYVLQVLGIFANHHYAKAAYVHASTLANLASYPVLFRALAGSWLSQAVVMAAAAATLVRAIRIHDEERPARWLALSWLAGSIVFLSVTAPLGRYASFFVPAMGWVVAEGAAAALAALAPPEPHPRGSGWRATGPSVASERTDPPNEDADRGQPPATGLFSRGLGIAWLAALCAAIALLTARAAREARAAEPGYRAAVDWMRERGSTRHISTSPYVSEVWAGVGAVDPVPGSPAELAALISKGDRYLLVDLIRNYFIGAFETRGAVLRSITKRCAPAATFPNAWATRPEYQFEFNYDIHETRGHIASAATDRSGVIEVYDLASCPAASAGGAPDGQEGTE